MVQVEARGVLDARRKHQSLVHCEAGQEMVELFHEADSGRLHPVHEDVARVGLARLQGQQAAQAVEADSLARPRGPHQGSHLARPERTAYVAEDGPTLAPRPLATAREQ